MILNTLINNILSLGYYGIILWFLFLLMIHQILAYTLSYVEQLRGVEVKVYSYDIIINIIFIIVFIYGIYVYNKL